MEQFACCIVGLIWYALLGSWRVCRHVWHAWFGSDHTESWLMLLFFLFQLDSHAEWARSAGNRPLLDSLFLGCQECLRVHNLLEGELTIFARIMSSSCSFSTEQRWLGSTHLKLRLVVRTSTQIVALTNVIGTPLGSSHSTLRPIIVMMIHNRRWLCKPCRHICLDCRIEIILQASLEISCIVICWRWQADLLLWDLSRQDSLMVRALSHFVWIGVVFLV